MEAAISKPLQVSTMIATRAKCANEVRVQRGVWQKWKDFNDHCDYYVVRMKNMHNMVCIRRRDTNATLGIDLVVAAQAGATKEESDLEWYIRIREMEWRPGNRTVYTSKHKWHAAAALKALHTYAPKFGNWKAIFNNCSTWVKGVVEFMKDDNKREQCECEPIVDDFDQLSSFGASLGVELTYLKFSEIDHDEQPQVHPEVDEPEEPADQKETEEVEDPQRDGSPQEHRRGPIQSSIQLTGNDARTMIEATNINGKEMESSMNEEVGTNGQNIDDFNNRD